MTRQEAADCLLDKTECRWCKANSETCRQDAERMGAESLLREMQYEHELNKKPLKQKIGGIIKWLKLTKRKS